MTPEEIAREWTKPLAWRTGYRTKGAYTVTVEETTITREQLDALIAAALAASEQRAKEAMEPGTPQRIFMALWEMGERHGTSSVSAKHIVTQLDELLTDLRAQLQASEQARAELQGHYDVALCAWHDEIKRREASEQALKISETNLRQYETESAEENNCTKHPKTMLVYHCAACAEASERTP